MARLRLHPMVMWTHLKAMALWVSLSTAVTLATTSLDAQQLNVCLTPPGHVTLLSVLVRGKSSWRNLFILLLPYRQCNGSTKAFPNQLLCGMDGELIIYILTWMNCMWNTKPICWLYVMLQDSACYQLSNYAFLIDLPITISKIQNCLQCS